jgi:hypothetical protein
LIIVVLAAAVVVASLAAVIAVVQIGVACEESERSLRFRPATLTSTITRRIVGAHGTFRP